MNDKNLGEFEILTLAALVRLDTNAYGASIRKEIETTTQRSVAIGQMYATLSRMEKKGYVTSFVGEGTPARGGRAKRFYEVQPLGRALLDKSLKDFASISVGIFAWPASTASKQ